MALPLGADAKLNLRGIEVSRRTLELFISGRKVWDIRNASLNCVQSGEVVYVFEQGARDVGKHWDLAGQALFRGNVKLNDFEFNEHFEKHQTSRKELDELRSSWPDRSRKHVIAWHLENFVGVKDKWVFFDGKEACARLVMSRLRVSMLCCLT